jgi:hypothetical protein
MAALQHMLGQPLRSAGVGGCCVQNGFHQREFGRAIGQPGAAHHVADDKYIGLECHLFCAKTFNQLDAQCAQLVAHGGVNASIAARYAMTRFTRQSCQAAHESATNTKNMNMHGTILRVTLWSHFSSVSCH